jgi:hypothetical protein
MSTPTVVQADDKVFQFPGETEAREFQADAKTNGSAAALMVPELPPPARTLYSLEEHLSSLVETADMVPAEQQGEFLEEFRQTLMATIEKRDRVAQFMAHLETQITFADAERKRLAELKAMYEKALAHVKTYVTYVIESLGEDAKGKRKKLEGRTSVLALHGCDKSLEVQDEAAVPTEYKTITFTLNVPAAGWDAFLDGLDFDLRGQILDANPKTVTNNALVKSTLKAGTEVPGAQLTGGQYVVRK